jgi:uncharacterized protein with von Willebrand factor type A (vWA) domain
MATHARPLEAIAGFAAHLRANGVAVGIAEQLAMVQAALAVDAAAPRRLRAGWRSIVCHGATDWRRYPELFDAYWFASRRRGVARIGTLAPARRDLRQLVSDLQASIAADAGAPKAAGDVALTDTAAGQSGEPAREHAQGGASRVESPAERDFGRWLPQDMGRLERIVEAIAQRLRRRLLRRMRHDARGRRLDVRRTLRASLRTGGEPFAPAWRRNRRERPQVFLLVDVSRSMETYAQLFLRIARAFVDVVDARVYVFHTRLADVTSLLRRDSAKTQDRIHAVTAGFGGGTRIAASIGEFVDRHARRGLSRSARLLILSDGFDSDPPDELQRQLGRAARRGARIYWLHPTREAPQSAALAPCRELIDAFAPVYNLDSLARLRELVE